MGIQDRKNDHLNLFKVNDVFHNEKTNGFEVWEWIPNETAGISFHEVNPVTSFLGYTLSFPFMIAALTGGTHEGNSLNDELAEIAEGEKIPFGTGSVRCALEKPEQAKAFYKLRDIAPSVPLIANIGIAQIRSKETRSNLMLFMKESRFDALAIHFNKIQEMIQEEGDRNFSGIMDGLKDLADTADFPLIAKGVGHGFSRRDIQNLYEAGIRFIDTGGAGGTSWAKAERFRNGDMSSSNPFDTWGISTAECLLTILNDYPGIFTIAGGGINDGFDTAKALALGAGLVSSAASVYKVWLSEGKTGTVNHILSRKNILKQIMFLTGCRDINTFQRNPEILRRKND